MASQAQNPSDGDPKQTVGGLAAELNKRQPFELLEEETLLNIVRTASVLSLESERVLREHGLSDAAYNVLRILRGRGSEGCSCTQIGRDMVARVPDVTRLVDRLERAGLATRSRAQEDRRVVQISITAAGIALLGTLDAPVREAVKAGLSGLSRDEMIELNRLLVKARRPACGRALAAGQSEDSDGKPGTKGTS